MTESSRSTTPCDQVKAPLPSPYFTHSKEMIGRWTVMAALIVRAIKRHLRSLATLKCELPLGFPFKKIFKLYRNGQVIFEKSSIDADIQIPVTEPGMYRLEIWAKTRTLFRVMLSDDTPYMLYNPIYVH